MDQRENFISASLEAADATSNKMESRRMAPRGDVCVHGGVDAADKGVNNSARNAASDVCLRGINGEPAELAGFAVSGIRDPIYCNVNERGQAFVDALIILVCPFLRRRVSSISCQSIADRLSLQKIRATSKRFEEKFVSSFVLVSRFIADLDDHVSIIFWLIARSRGQFE